MSWNDPIITADDDNPSAGNVSATFNDGTADVFIYSRRVTIAKAGDIAAFVAEAKKELADFQSQKTTADTLASQIHASLNS